MISTYINCNTTGTHYHRRGVSDSTCCGAELKSDLSWSDSDDTNSDHIYHEDENVTQYSRKW